MIKNSLEKLRQKNSLTNLRETKNCNSKKKRTFFFLILVLIILSCVVSGIYFYSNKNKYKIINDLKSNPQILRILKNNDVLLRCTVVKKGVLFPIKEAYIDIFHKDFVPSKKQIIDLDNSLNNELRTHYSLDNIYIHSYNTNKIKLQYGERFDSFLYEYVTTKDKNNSVNKKIAILYSNKDLNLLDEIKENPKSLPKGFLSLCKYDIIDAIKTKSQLNLKIKADILSSKENNNNVLYFLQQLSHQTRKLNTCSNEIYIDCDIDSKKISEDTNISEIKYSTNFISTLKLIQQLQK